MNHGNHCSGHGVGLKLSSRGSQATDLQRIQVAVLGIHTLLCYKSWKQQMSYSFPRNMHDTLKQEEGVQLSRFFYLSEIY